MQTTATRPKTKRRPGRLLLTIAGRHENFASPRHPGWLRFLDRLALELPDDRHDAEGQPDQVAARLLDASGVGRLEMTDAVRCYLCSRIGASALVAEGVALTDSMLKRDEIRLDVRDLPEPLYLALAIVPPG